MLITLRGVDIHVEQAGQGGRSVLLLHGWGCDMGHFQPIAEELSANFRVTMLDFPAHGQSARPPAPWGVTDFAAQTAELIERLDIAPCDVIAHSFGGRVALYLAANRPELINRLVLTGCAGLRKPQTGAQKRRAARYRLGKRFYESVGRLGGLFRALSEMSLDALRQKFGSADYNALDEEMRKTFVRVVSEDLSPLLPRVRASTLLVWGENDADTPLWMGKRMEADIPDAGLVVFEGDDHYAYLRQWLRFVRVVQAFLQ